MRSSQSTFSPPPSHPALKHRSSCVDEWERPEHDFDATVNTAMKDVPGMCTTPMYSFPPVDGAPDPELVRIRDLIYRVAGIFHPDTKLRLLFDRCARRMKEVKASSLREYFEYLTLRATRQTELIALLNEITIGETRFFRSPPQLDALRQIILPKIASERNASGSVLASVERWVLHR
ncbi:MAG TPA: hypothetical protein VMG82_16560 [Candidatus Sulfotelmatobacter sp.]|nr:hypothetical protein [Candidatus Sulfotelmatobacter sp.]